MTIFSGATTAAALATATIALAPGCDYGSGLDSSFASSYDSDRMNTLGELVGEGHQWFDGQSCRGGYSCDSISEIASGECDGVHYTAGRYATCNGFRQECTADSVVAVIYTYDEAIRAGGLNWKDVAPFDVVANGSTWQAKQVVHIFNPVDEDYDFCRHVDRVSWPGLDGDPTTIASGSSWDPLGHDPDADGGRSDCRLIGSTEELRTAVGLEGPAIYPAPGTEGSSVWSDGPLDLSLSDVNPDLTDEYPAGFSGTPASQVVPNSHYGLAIDQNCDGVIDDDYNRPAGTQSSYAEALYPDGYYYGPTFMYARGFGDGYAGMAHNVRVAFDSKYDEKGDLRDPAYGSAVAGGAHLAFIPCGNVLSASADDIDYQRIGARSTDENLYRVVKLVGEADELPGAEEADPHLSRGLRVLGVVSGSDGRRWVRVDLSPFQNLAAEELYQDGPMPAFESYPINPLDHEETARQVPADAWVRYDAAHSRSVILTGDCGGVPQAF